MFQVSFTRLSSARALALSIHVNRQTDIFVNKFSVLSILFVQFEQSWVQISAAKPVWSKWGDCFPGLAKASRPTSSRAN